MATLNKRPSGKWQATVRRDVFLPQTENGHARTVPLSPTAVHVLATLPRTDARCVPLSGNSVRLAFDRLRTRARVVDLTFHDIRHEAVSRFVESDLSLAQVQMISGHRDLRMLMLAGLVFPIPVAAEEIVVEMCSFQRAHSGEGIMTFTDLG